jgi:hypothetical protein|tara:strand:+ start:687 stop:851 length:165 start_codon:yes stop_codon:yes gene_type:complete
MDKKLEKLFDQLDTLKDKEADILEEIKNRLYDLNEAGDEDEYDDDEEFDEEEDE